MPVNPQDLPEGLPENYARTHIRWQTPEPGWMEFDAILRQTIEHDGEVTEHPVDRQAVITDHYRRVNPPITIETLITNSPITLPLTHAGGAEEIQQVSTVTLPQPIYPGAPTTVGGFDITSKNIVQIVSRDFQDPGALNGRSGLDRVNLVYEELRAIQEEARVLSVHMSTIKGGLGQGGSYESMLLRRFSIDQDPGMANAVALTMEFKQVIFADVLTEDLSGQIPRKPRDKRSNKGKDAGAQPAKEKDTEQETSLLGRLVGL